MKMKHDLPHIDRYFDIDEASAARTTGDAQNEAAVYRSSNVPQAGVSYLWNGNAQKLVPVLLDENDPNYRANREMVSQTIERWNRGDFK